MTPTCMANWLEIFFWLMGGAAVVFALFFLIFPRRQPPIDADLAKLATKDELKTELKEYAKVSEVEKMEDRIVGRMSKSDDRFDSLAENIDRQFTDLRRVDEIRASGLHKRVNAILQYTAATDAKVQMLPCVKGNPGPACPISPEAQS